MSVVSFKVRREIKEKMKKYKDRIKWAEELRKFVEEKIRELEAEENMENIVNPERFFKEICEGRP